jgi:hypothetical protein
MPFQIMISKLGWNHYTAYKMNGWNTRVTILGTCQEVPWMAGTTKLVTSQSLYTVVSPPGPAGLHPTAQDSLSLTANIHVKRKAKCQERSIGKYNWRGSRTPCGWCGGGLIHGSYLLGLSINNSMKHNLSWEVHSCSGCQEIVGLLCNLRIPHHSQRSSQLTPILSQTNSVHTITLYFWTQNYIWANAKRILRIFINKNHYIFKCTYECLNPQNATVKAQQNQ